MPFDSAGQTAGDGALECTAGLRPVKADPHPAGQVGVTRRGDVAACRRVRWVGRPAGGLNARTGEPGRIGNLGKSPDPARQPTHRLNGD